MTPWTVVSQGPLSIGFSRQEYWSRLPFSPPEDHTDPGIKPMSLMSAALAGGFFTTAGSGPGKGVWVSLSTSGHPDMTGSVYNKTQTFGEQGFHAETLPSFSLPSALGSTGPLAPGPQGGPQLHTSAVPAHFACPPAASLTAGCCNRLLQGAQSRSGQHKQSPSSLQPKSQAFKPTWGNSPYWTN